MATRKRPSTPKNETQHYTNVLLEEMRSHQKVMLEALTSWREESLRRFDAIDKKFEAIDKRFDGIDRRLDGIDKRLDGIDKRLDRLEQRVDLLESAIRHHSTEIRELREDLRKLRADVDAREDRARIAALEERVERLEQQLAS